MRVDYPPWKQNIPSGRQPLGIFASWKGFGEAIVEASPYSTEKPEG
jgi:hypothetical protein